MGTRPTKLTEHFSLKEFEISPTAIALKIDNTIPDELLPNIQRLAEALERVRELLGGRSIRINSGYRTLVLNRAVKGAPRSAHLRGLAADIVVPGLTPKAVCQVLTTSDLEFDKCICEGNSPGWTHFAIPELNQPARRITLTAHFDKDGNATYTEGLA